MNIITKKFAASALALFALALPVSPAFAADLDTGWYAESYVDSYPMGYDDYGTGWYAESYTDSYPMGYDSTGWYAESYTDSYPMSYDYGYSTPSYSYPSYSSPSFSYPSFSQPPVYTSGANQQYRQYIAPQLPTFVQPNVSNACTAVNSCNVDNSYTDNSVYAPDNSYTYTNTVTDNSVYSAPVTVTAPTTISYGPVTTTHDSHNQQISYPQPQYQAPVFPVPQYQQQYQYQAQYQQPVYQPHYQQPRPTYPQTPYVTLSSLPYTGLELGPVGEVLYWSFLIFWCLAIAYLIVYKRVLQKTVSFLSGALFGSATVAHAGHAHAAPKAAAAASAPAQEEGMDPFIASQIKR